MVDSVVGLDEDVAPSPVLALVEAVVPTEHFAEPLQSSLQTIGRGVVPALEDCVVD